MKVLGHLMRNAPLAVAVILSLTVIIPMAPIASGAYGKDTSIGVAQASFWGEIALDNSGTGASIVGDVNGDGYDDIVIGAPNRGSTFPTISEVYLIFGKAAGWSKDQRVNLVASASFLSEANGDKAGFRVAPAGDANGDGYDDFLISAPFGDKGFLDGGQVYLILGKKTGWAMKTALSNADASFVATAAGENVGCSIAGAGDVNGDGFDDIIIGADNNNEVGMMAGKAYVIFGRASGWTRNIPLSQSDASFLGEAMEDQAGTSVATGGDLNGDGYDDILIGALLMQQGNAGKTYVIFGKASGWAKGTSLKSAGASFKGIDMSELSASSLAIAGDVNKDGFDDILIGAPAASPLTITNAGRVYLVLGKASNWGIDVSLTNANAKFTGEAAGDFTGDRVGGGGDINGDGLDDIIIGSPRRTLAVSGLKGEVHIIKGRATGWADLTMANADASFWGETGQDSLGDSISITGDVNGDGFDDILASSSSNNEGGGATGQTYLVFFDLNAPPMTVQSVKAFTGPDYGTETTFALPGDTIYVELRGSDPNASRTDLVIVNASSDSSILPIKLELRETGLSTGVFRGPLMIGNKTSEPRFGIHSVKAQPGDIVDLAYFKDATKNATLTIGRVTLLPIADETLVQEDQAYTAQYSVANATIATWVFQTDAAWLKWDPVAKNLTGTPNNTQIGAFWVNITVSDAMGRYDEHNFSLTVGNNPPTISTAAVTAAEQDEPYLVDYNSSDDGQGTITWALATNASWLHINTTTGVVNGTPHNIDVGRPFANVSVNDGNGGMASQNFTIDVMNANDPPIITSADVTTATEDELYSVQYLATDPDVVDTRTWSVVSNATWLSMSSSTGILSGSPANADVGWYNVNVTVTDAAFEHAWRAFVLTVQNVNDPPTWANAPSNTTIDRNATYVFDVNGTDIDKGDSLAYGLKVAPSTATASINITTGVLSWTPDGSGNYIFDISASDAFVTIHHNFTITVRPPVIPNHAPTISPISDQTVKSGKAFSFRVLASDPDLGDTINYSLVGAPEGMTVTPAGFINWTPLRADIGTHLITVRVSDGKVFASTSFNLTVEKVSSGGTKIDKILLPGLAITLGGVAAAGAAYTVKSKMNKQSQDKQDKDNPDDDDMDIEEALFIHKDGRIIGDKVKDDKKPDDEMISKVQTVIRKHNEEGKELASTVTTHGNKYVMIQKGEYSYLVAVVPGAQSFSVKAVTAPLKLIRTLEKFEKANMEALREWDGKKEALKDIDKELKELL